MIFPWLLLGALFVAPFFDVRRPFRLLHFDLAVLVGAGIPALYGFLAGRDLALGVLMTFAALAYLSIRMIYGGVRPRRGNGPLIPHVPLVWLAVAVVLLAAGRLGYALAEDRYPFDVGLSSALGAERILDGRGLYDGELDKRLDHSDTYGPVMYLSYIPFQALWPLARQGEPAGYPRALRAAAISFDLLTLAALVCLGLRLRRGRRGRELAVALAWAWVAYPYTLLVLAWSFNDAVVALIVTLALVSLARPTVSSLLAGLATAAKYAPAVLAPVLAAGSGERSPRQVATSLVVFGLTICLVFLPFVVGVDLGELYDRTLGLQETREPRNTVWGTLGQGGLLQALSHGLVLLLAVAVAFVPRRRTPVQAAALSAGLLAALALTMSFWVAMYLLWLAPAAFAALLAGHVEEDPTSSAPGVASGDRARSYV